MVLLTGALSDISGTNTDHVGEVNYGKDDFWIWNWHYIFLVNRELHIK